ncbi:MAG: hypothetical protein ABI947_26330 [Chloroflexota bacterium]
MDTNLFIQSMDIKWEYRYFVYTTFEPHSTWVTLAGHESYTAALARQFFWENFKEQILTELDQRQNEGWEILDEVVPTALQIRQSVQIETGIEPADVVLWIITLGVALLLQLLAGNRSRQYVVYEPVEFRVEMRHVIEP